MHSYICIIAFHLGTIDVPREGCDVEAELEDGEWWTRLLEGCDVEVELEDGEWWTRLEDGRMDLDVHDRRKKLAEQLSSN